MPKVKFKENSGSGNKGVRGTKMLKWTKYAKKDLMIDVIVKKKWSSRSKTELQRDSVENIEDKLRTCLEKYGTLQEIQQLEERVMGEEKMKEEKRKSAVDETRKKKETCLVRAKEYFVVKQQVYVYDESVVIRYGREIRKYDPIPAHVVDVSKDGKLVTVQYDVTRQWHEAGNYWVQRGQQMKFKFDPITCKWLRDGMTAEVVRSYGLNGRSVYFELKYTRQFLILPEH